MKKKLHQKTPVTFQFNKWHGHENRQIGLVMHGIRERLQLDRFWLKLIIFWWKRVFWWKVFFPKILRACATKKMVRMRAANTFLWMFSHMEWASASPKKGPWDRDKLCPFQKFWALCIIQVIIRDFVFTSLEKCVFFT